MTTHCGSFHRVYVILLCIAGSYTKQDYIDSMEGATMSGHLAAAAILEKKAELAKNLAVS